MPILLYSGGTILALLAGGLICSSIYDGHKQGKKGWDLAKHSVEYLCNIVSPSCFTTLGCLAEVEDVDIEMDIAESELRNAREYLLSNNSSDEDNVEHTASTNIN